MSQVILTHACRLCHATNNLGECTQCHRAFYCLSRACQKLDWKNHKVFCKKGEDKQLAQARLEVCLKTIREDSTAASTFLFQQTNARTAGCFIIRPHRFGLFAGINTMAEVFVRLNIVVDESTSNELMRESARCAAGTAIPILFADQQGTCCFVVGGRGLADLKSAVNHVPEEVLELIYIEYLKICKSLITKEDLEYVENSIKDAVIRSSLRELEAMELEDAPGPGTDLGDD